MAHFDRDGNLVGARSQAQRDAQLNASQASANARYRRGEALARRRAEEEAAQAERDAHVHRWSDWQTDDDEWNGFTLLVETAHQVRHCTDRQCEATDRRELRL